MILSAEIFSSRYKLLVQAIFDFRWAVVIAMFSTTCAVILLLVGMALDYRICAPHQSFNKKLVATNYFLGFGTFIFAYSGHAAFPTIIHDMHKPYHFTRSSIAAYASMILFYFKDFKDIFHLRLCDEQGINRFSNTIAVILVLYGPVCILGFLTYGNSLRDSVINSIQTVTLQQPANILIGIHCILTLTIIFNPLNQEVEERFNVPHSNISF